MSKKKILLILCFAKLRNFSKIQEKFAKIKIKFLQPPYIYTIIHTVYTFILAAIPGSAFRVFFIPSAKTTDTVNVNLFST